MFLIFLGYNWWSWFVYFCIYDVWGVFGIDFEGMCYLDGEIIEYKGLSEFVEVEVEVVKEDCGLNLEMLDFDIMFVEGYKLWGVV